MTQPASSPTTKSSRLAPRISILLSAMVFPGTGQVMQRRYLAAALYAIPFAILFIRLLYIIIVPMIANVEIALELAQGSSDRELQQLSVSDILITFLMGFVVYIANIIDAWSGARRMTASEPPSGN
jgi:hypothetical protein